MTATDAQVEIAMKELEKGRTQQQAAAKANLRDRHTVYWYKQQLKKPSELRKPRTYLTRENPFADDWPALAAQLEAEPSLEAKVLFEWLCDERPGKYQLGQMRTLQRHVRRWRAQHVQQVVSLPQVRRPGELMQTDGTWMNTLGIMIAGEPFGHIFIHSVLVYSNWEWGRIAQSESFLALEHGLKSTLQELGHVPAVHQTDQSTAATHQLRQAGETGHWRYNEAYAGLMAELGMEPRTTHVRSPDENGDIEAVNGSFKRAVEQALLLRGSRDFPNEAEYEVFLEGLLRRRNKGRQVRLDEELAVMRPLTGPLRPAVRVGPAHVSRDGTIRFLNRTYSVPSSLVGQTVMVHAGERELAIYYDNACIEQMPRLTGQKRHTIQYRHVIDSLLKKPGGFRDYRYRDDLFPSLVFRQAWDALCARLSARRADLAYLRILKLAAMTLETDVAAVLDSLLAGDEAWDDETVKVRLQPAIGTVPDVVLGPVSLADYDQLLTQDAGDATA